MEGHRMGPSVDADLFFAFSPDLLCIADFEGRFVKVNPAWEHTLGYSAAELLSVRYFDFIHPDDRQRTVEEASRLKREAGNVTLLNRYRCKDGSYRWLRWNARSDLSRGR